MGKNVSASSAPRTPVASVTVATRLSAKNLAAAIGRHALPLVSVYVLHGTTASFLLLTAFNLALGLMLIVGTTRQTSDPTGVDPRSRWAVMRWIAVLLIAVMLALVAAIIAIPIAMPAVLLGLAAGVDWMSLLAQKNLLVPAAFMALLAAMQAQILFEERTTPGARGPASQAAPVVGDLAQDRRRSLAAYAAQVTLIGTYVFVCVLLLEFGAWGLSVFPLLYTALLVFYDARPDIAQRIFPQLWGRA
jgi:hypothetical protein